MLARKHNLKKSDILPLREMIRQHNYLYHDQESPIITDTEYDELFHALARLEVEHDMLDENSPTARLAILTSSQFQKVPHLYPMISLDNTYSPEDIRDFEDRVRRILEKNNQSRTVFDYYIQPKYDGLWLALIYKNGAFVQAVTRGSGVAWEDVTLGAMEISGVPHTIHEIAHIDRVEIRGEVMMSRTTFDRVNRERLAVGEKPFANPRNAASWSLRQLDPLITRDRNLEFFAYSLPEIEQGILKGVFEVGTYTQMMWLLLDWWFDRRDFDFKNIEWIDALIAMIEQETNQRKDYFDFDIDGMVLKLDDMTLWDMLGRTEHHPRYSIAYKFPAKQVRTKVLSIDHSVGRTGTVTPVANLEPVEVTGVVVKRATLHNYDELVKKDVRIGDQVFVMRAGEVIPEIVWAITDVRDGSERSVLPPTQCPICATPLEQDDGKVAIFCPNNHCPAKIQGQLEMLVSKQGLDIDGFGERQIALFLQKGWITDFASIFHLKKFREQFFDIEWYQQKSVNNLLEAIESARNTTLDRVFVALGIPNVWKKTAKLIANTVFCMGDNFRENIFSLSQEALIATKDIGPETAISFAKYMQENKMLVERFLDELMINIPQKKYWQDSGVISGMTFCVTGSFDDISRDDIHTLIEQHGGVVRSSVSAKLDYLVAGEKAWSKLQKAQSIGIKIIDIDTLQNLLLP